MVSELNLSNLTVDANGRVSFSGLTSGIDFESVVRNIVAAKRIPVDRVQAEIDSRTAKIAALNDLNTLLANLKNSVSQLYGAVSFQNSTNAFEAKQAFASTSRTDGASPAASASLMGVTVTNGASTGSHTVELLRVAKAHKITGGSVPSVSDDLSTSLGLTDGSFDINGTTVNVYATDTLGDLRDRINAANKGATATGVSASIVSVGANSNYLVLTSSETGEENAISLSNETGGVLSGLGISDDGGTTFSNELQAATDARLKVDGLKDLTRYESDALANASAKISNFISTAPSTGSFSVTVGATTQVINYDATTQSLSDIKDAINTAFGSTVASISSETNGARLVIDGGGANVTIADTDGLLAELGVDNDLVVTRASNSIDDLIAGTTLTLYQAEEGTTIKIDVEEDLTAVKTKISAFVDAYNDVRQFINLQNATDPNTGLKSGESGPLFGSNVLSAVQQKLGNIVGTGVIGSSGAYSVLAQIGINIVSDSGLTDPTLKNTLEFGTNVQGQSIDEALLNHAEDVRKLFAFDFSASSPEVTLLAFSGRTQYSATGYTINIQPSVVTNLLKYSEQADNAAWTQTRATIEVDGATAPDGTTTADGIVGDATNDSHVLSNTDALTVTSGESYTFSTYLKAGDKSIARIAMSGANFAADAEVEVDLSSGTVSATGAGADSSAIEDVGGGWYRVTLTATATGDGDAFVERQAEASVGDPVYTGDGSTVDLWTWGAQFEESATAGNYLQSEATSATGPSANVGGSATGADNGTATFTTSRATVIDGGAEGLQLFYGGSETLSDVQVDFTIGVGAQMYFAISDLSAASGVLQSEIDALTDQNEVADERVTAMTSRIDYDAIQLRSRFIRMETALATSRSIMDSINQTTSAWFSNN